MSIFIAPIVVETYIMKDDVDDFINRQKNSDVIMPIVFTLMAILISFILQWEPIASARNTTLVELIANLSIVLVSLSSLIVWIRYIQRRNNQCWINDIHNEAKKYQDGQMIRVDKLLGTKSNDKNMVRLSLSIFYLGLSLMLLSVLITVPL